MRAYCDDRAAALSLAAALQQENDLLRAENERLRELVDPGAGGWREAFAQVSSAITVTLMLLGAMVGAGLIVEQTASAAEATVTRDVDLDSRLAVASPHDVDVVGVLVPQVVVAPPSTLAVRSPQVAVAPASRGHRHARHHHRHHRHHRRHRHHDRV